MRLGHRPLRRAIIGGTVGAFTALLCVLGPVAASAAATTAWRADGYGPGNTGYNPIETAINAETVDELEYGWSITSPVVRSSCSRQSPPVVANNRLYLTDQGGLAAYNATTGTRLWTYRFAVRTDELAPELSVVGSRVFATFTTCRSVSDADSTIRAFDASTGAQLWQVNRDEAIQGTVVDKDIVVAGGGDAFFSAVSAYRVTDGSLVWRRDADMTRAVSANGRVLINPHNEEGSPTGSELLDVRTGATLWSTATTYHALAAGPTGGPIYATGPGATLVRLNVETGAVAWSVPAAATQLAVDGPRLYVVEGTDLVARDSGTGAELWREAYGVPLGKPVVAGGVLYATASGRGTDPLDPATGADLDDEAPFDRTIEHPVIVNGRLYATDGRVLDAFTL
jgi:outer membrane protein assembly factor BamB